MYLNRRERESMKTALLSVYSKEGIVKFAKALMDLGDWQIIASGGTAKVLSKAKIPVRDVADLVGGQAILGHRVVTLSRQIHAALLARNTEEDQQELERLGIPRIDLVCVDLYPLEEEINNPASTIGSVIEKTDIGGPTLLRSAAKGRRIVICDPADRMEVISWLRSGQPNREGYISHLAAKAEFVVSRYSLASAQYHSDGSYQGILGGQLLSCNYGENAWQTPAGLFRTGSKDPLALGKFEIVAGALPSYNNLCDVDRLLQTMTHIVATYGRNCSQIPLVAVAVKHGNPCGAAVGMNRLEVLKKMVIGNTREIFGGLVMTNFPLDEGEAEILLSYQVLVGRRILDGIIAPSFTTQAVEMLRRKKDKCRFLANPALADLDTDSLDFAPRFRYVRGGFLRQPNYTFVLDLKHPELEKFGQATPEQEKCLLLAWAIGSTSNSNTIVLTKNGSLIGDDHLIGSGTGQRDRVGACQLAVHQAKEAGHKIEGAVAYSDSFFPFPDGPAVLAKAGVKVILSSSGSIKDKETIQYCQKHGVVLYLIPDKIGRGFFGH